MESGRDIEASEAERRLCALAAIDMAGYSGRAEADEAQAVNAVVQLSARIAEAAKAQRGRVFNTAGDGFMLEFPTVTGALAAAEAIVAAAPAPVRVGVHVGEVSVTPGGDLLGHGVNVAARLQALAAPGEIVVSDDVRRAAPRPVAERLTPVGRVRLAKMKETGVSYNLALADRQEAVISQDRVRKGDLGGARLILSGGVERDGPLLRVRVQFDDARAGRAVWSGVYERSAGDLLALQDQAANSVASIISGVTDLGPNARRTSPELLAAYMTAVESGLEHRASNEQSREAFRRLAALVPRASRVHARYAVVIMDSLIFSQESPEAIARWRALATAEANKAIALRPHDAYSYVALLDTLPRWAFPEREALLNLALAAVADDPDLLSVQVGHLGEVGRPAEALAIAEQAMTLGRATPSRVTDLIFRLAGAGRWPDASALGQRQARLTPANNSTRRANLLTAIIYAPPAEALQAIDRYQATDPHLAPEAEAAWRDVVAARAGKLPAGAAAKAVAAAPRGEYGVDPSTAMSAYSMLGRLDLAFAEVERAQGGHYEFYIANLFQGATVAMRRDPRFMPMAARLGLVDYWMKSGHWPDFCQDPGLPYDCRAAARAATQAPGRSRAPNRT